MAPSCNGCGKVGLTEIMQCPLCQALELDGGFFCSQECFAANFVKHRDEVHPKGVVKTKDKGKVKAKKEQAGAASKEAAVAPPPPEDKSAKQSILWPKPPPLDSARAPKWFTEEVKRKVVDFDVPDSSPATSVPYEAALLATHFVEAQTGASASATDAVGAVVVCGSAFSCHLMAWLCRCRGLDALMILNTASPIQPTPSYKADQQAISSRQEADSFVGQVATAVASTITGDKKDGGGLPRVLILNQSVAEAGPASAGPWVEGRLMVTLPDVNGAEALQTLTTRALFINKKEATTPTATAAAADAKKKKPTKAPLQPASQQQLPVMQGPHRYESSASAASYFMLTVPEELSPVVSKAGADSSSSEDDDNDDSSPKSRQKGPVVATAAHRRLFDNALSNILVSRGELFAFSERLLAIHRAGALAPCDVEQLFFNAAVCDRGDMFAAPPNTPSSSVAALRHQRVRLFHHRLATLLRRSHDGERTKEDGEQQSIARQHHAATSFTRIAGRALSRVAQIVAAAEGTIDALRESDEAASSSYDSARNPYLEATLTYLCGEVKASTIDKLGAAWGVSRIVHGAKHFDRANKLRQGAVHAIRMRYRTGLDERWARFLVVLMHLVADTVGGWISSRRKQMTFLVGDESAAAAAAKSDAGSSSRNGHQEADTPSSSSDLERVSALLLWPYVLQPFCGALKDFLLTACLLHTEEQVTEAFGTQAQRASLLERRAAAQKEAGSSRKPPQAKKHLGHKIALGAQSVGDDAALHVGFLPRHEKPSAKRPRSEVATQSDRSIGLKLRTERLPLGDKNRRKTELMTKMALEEVLSNMPNVPVMIGDVGQYIGVWTKFNAKYHGKLPTTLKAFLLDHPDQFRVAGEVVNRISQGGQRVPVTFKHGPLNEGDDSDDEEAKTKRRRVERMAKFQNLTTTASRHNADAMIARALGTKKAAELGGRARKKKLKSLRNKARYNKNKKSVTDDQKVKGYKKPHERAVKGRGRKKNIRTTKRA